MRFLKKLTSFVIIIVVLIMFIPSAFAAEPDQRDDYIVPLRLVAEAAGYEVKWNGAGAPIHLIGYYNQITSCTNYIMVGNRAYAPVGSIITLLSNNGADNISIMAVDTYVYRISIRLEDDIAPVAIERSFATVIDNDRCLITLYSDGNNEQKGGPHTVLIEITVTARDL